MPDRWVVIPSPTVKDLGLFGEGGTACFRYFGQLWSVMGCCDAGTYVCRSL